MSRDREPVKKKNRKEKKANNLSNMVEEVEVSPMAKKNSAGPDETAEVTAPASSSDECAGQNSVEKNNTNSDGSVLQPQPEKSPKKPSTAKPQDNSFEKSKKWYNIGFMHRTGSSSNSRSVNTTDGKNSIKMDNRHSWHLNDSSEM